MLRNNSQTQDYILNEFMYVKYSWKELIKLQMWSVVAVGPSVEIKNTQVRTSIRHLFRACYSKAVSPHHLHLAEIQRRGSVKVFQ